MLADVGTEGIGTRVAPAAQSILSAPRLGGDRAVIPMRTGGAPLHCLTGVSRILTRQPKAHATHSHELACLDLYTGMGAARTARCRGRIVSCSELRRDRNRDLRRFTHRSRRARRRAIPGGFARSLLP